MTEDAIRFHLIVALRDVAFTSMLTSEAQDGLREDLVQRLKEQGALDDKIKCRHCHEPIMRTNPYKFWTHISGVTGQPKCDTADEGTTYATP